MDDGRADDPVPEKTTWEVAPDLEGRMLGDFRIVRKLGEGGMGIVFEAEQQHPKRPVALKVIRGDLRDGPNQSGPALLRDGVGARRDIRRRHVPLFGVP
jgi:serine/threonine protein kinase